LSVRLSLERPESPREEPAESDGHGELGSDDSDDEDERNVENDVRGDATDGLGRDESDGSDILEAGHLLLESSSSGGHGEIESLVRRVLDLHVVVDHRPGRLRGLEPLEDVEIEDGTERTSEEAMRRKQESDELARREREVVEKKERRKREDSTHV